MEQAVEAVQREVQTQQLRPEDVTPATLEAHLYTQVPPTWCLGCPATWAHVVERAAVQSAHSDERRPGGQGPASHCRLPPQELCSTGVMEPRGCWCQGGRRLQMLPASRVAVGMLWSTWGMQSQGLAARGVACLACCRCAAEDPWAPPIVCHLVHLHGALGLL